MEIYNQPICLPISSLSGRKFTFVSTGDSLSRKCICGKYSRIVRKSLRFSVSICLLSKLPLCVFFRLRSPRYPAFLCSHPNRVNRKWSRAGVNVLGFCSESWRAFDRTPALTWCVAPSACGLYHRCARCRALQQAVVTMADMDGMTIRKYFYFVFSDQRITFAP